ncbi:MAG: hypothetical protein WED00_18940 [Aquisalimonadaceae bacterium]
MRKTLVALMLLMPIGVMAQTPSYTHVEGGLDIVDPPGRFGGSDTGVLVRGSLALDELIFVRAALSSHRYSERVGPPPRTRVTVDRDLLSAGVGFRVPTEQLFDLYGAADVLYDFGDADDAGFRLEGGAKAVLEGGWDSTAGLRVERLDDRNFVQVFASTWYELAPQFSLGGELAVGDFDEVLLGARYRF